MPHYLGMVVGHERFWAGTHAYSDRTSYGCSTAPPGTTMHYSRHHLPSSLSHLPMIIFLYKANFPPQRHLFQTCPQGLQDFVGLLVWNTPFPTVTCRNAPVSWGVLLQILTSEMSRLTPGISGVLLWRFASHDQISHMRSHLRYAAHTINRPRTWMKWMWYWDFSKVIFIQGITWQKINMLCE